MTTRQLTDAFTQWTASGQPLVLASVYATEGSTYSKPGAQMLIRSDGVFQGMLSGGCLEGDLALRAKTVAESGQAQAICYDLGKDDDELWGLGVGCDGLIRVFLQLLQAKTHYQPFPSMQAAYEGLERQVSATVIASTVAGLAMGSTLVMQRGCATWSDIAEKFQPRIGDVADVALSEKRSQTVSVEFDGRSCELLLTVIRPFPRILVLGGGMDAEPVVRLVAEMGWRAVVSDHRSAYLDKGDFSKADQVHCIAATDLAREIDLDHFDAAIVMSHHLATDESYLRQLAASDVAYVGLLGPLHRRERLVKKLGEHAGLLEGRLYGPAGIDINASGSAAIALSIVAQLQQQID